MQTSSTKLQDHKLCHSSYALLPFSVASCMCSDILATLEIHTVNEKAADSCTICDKECEPTCCGPIVVLVFLSFCASKGVH